MGMDVIHGSLKAKALQYEDFVFKIFYQYHKTESLTPAQNEELHVMLGDMLSFMRGLSQYRLLLSDFSRPMLQDYAVNSWIRALDYHVQRMPHVSYDNEQEKLLRNIEDIAKKCLVVFGTMFGVDDLDTCRHVAQSPRRPSSLLYAVLSFEGEVMSRTIRREVFNFFSALDMHTTTNDASSLLTLIENTQVEHPRLADQIVDFAQSLIDSQSRNSQFPDFKSQDSSQAQTPQPPMLNLAGVHYLLVSIIGPYFLGLPHARMYGEVCMQRGKYVEHGHLGMEFAILCSKNENTMGLLFFRYRHGML